MQAFDHDYVYELMTRVGRIRPEAKPAWGSMTPEEMVAHLTETVRYTLGRGPELPLRGNWFTRTVLGPLILNGIVPIPRNVKVPRPAGDPGPKGDAETLHAVLEEYLSRVQTGDLNPPPHPVFGDIGIDGWAKMHVRHFEHHLRQFGV